MASLIPDTICMKNRGLRRVGITKANHTFQNLHNPQLRAEEEETAILAPPRDLSDEESNKQKQERSPEDANSERKQGKYAFSEFKPPASLSQPNVNHTRRTKTTPQQNDQKRHSDPIADDSMIFYSQQRSSKKLRASYSRKNIHNAPKASSQPGKLLEGPRAGKMYFRASEIPPENTLSHSTPPEAGATDHFNAPAFKMPLMPLQRRLQDVEDAKGDNNQPKFNQPKRPPAKALSPERSNLTPVFRSYGNSSRTTRSSQGNRKPLTVGDTNTSPPQAQIQDVIISSAGMLGLNDAEKSASTSTDTLTSQVSCKLDNLTKTSVPVNIETSLNQQSRSETLSYSTKHQQNPSSDCISVLSGLSSPPDSPSKARCPLCKDLVEKLFLDEFTGGKRMTIRQQAEFCKAHKIRSAQGLWRDRRYPDIEWSNFERKLTSLHPRLEELLQGNKQSYYRNALEDTVRSGKNRTLKQAMLQGEMMEGLSPGYYGSRGAKIMVDNIISRFSSKLRRLGRTDRLISASGVSGYVQAVLAPELAVMLVMDDMNTDQDSAREILRDSVDIGNLLNEEEDEMMQCEPVVEGDVDLIEV